MTRVLLSLGLWTGSKWFVGGLMHEATHSWHAAFGALLVMDLIYGGVMYLNTCTGGRHEK